MTHDEYVTSGAWVRAAGRTDAVDVVAEEFERPSARWTAAPVPAAAVPSARPATPPSGRWPRASRGWRSLGLLHGRDAEERLHS